MVSSARASARVVAATALSAGCWTAAAFWHESLCDGEGDPLCAAPWLHSEAPVISLAARPDKCLTLAGDGAGGALRLADCTVTDGAQRFAAFHGSVQLRLAKDSGDCVGGGHAEDVAGADDAAAGPFFPVLTKTACGGKELDPSASFEMPERGQGAIRWSLHRDLCLTVGADLTAPPKSATLVGAPVSLQPCVAGAPGQKFIAPRALYGSAFVGVNLGGWLILEEWMWPEEMEHQGVHDEWSLVAKYGGVDDERAQDFMRKHWDSFLLEEHLDQLARFGVTHVRIPLGYWLLESMYDKSDGFVHGGEFYLARAIGWLKARRMKAVLDLHALPGGQARNDGFTGRRWPDAMFFREPQHFERGKQAVEALADLILKYEADVATSGVVMGIELLNEPNDHYFEGELSITSFYKEMVPRVRAKLPADKYMIMLSFMDSPHVKSAKWLAEQREQDPKNFAGVVYDAHLYHLFGDNTGPWTPDQDKCKTCCRDTHLLEGAWSRGVPVVVGEYGMSTGFPGWEADGFERVHLEDQLSVWNTTRAVVGSFTWNFRIMLAESHPDLYKEWSVIDLIRSGFVPEDGVYASNLTARCPSIHHALDVECPAFDENTYWDAKCEFRRKLASQPVGDALDARDLALNDDDVPLTSGEDSDIELDAAPRGARLGAMVAGPIALVLSRLVWA